MKIIVLISAIILILGIYGIGVFWTGRYVGYQYGYQDSLKTEMPEMEVIKVELVKIGEIEINSEISIRYKGWNISEFLDKLIKLEELKKEEESIYKFIGKI